METKQAGTPAYPGVCDAFVLFRGIFGSFLAYVKKKQYLCTQIQKNLFLFAYV